MSITKPSATTTSSTAGLASSLPAPGEAHAAAPARRRSSETPASQFVSTTAVAGRASATDAKPAKRRAHKAVEGPNWAVLDPAYRTRNAVRHLLTVLAPQDGICDSQQVRVALRDLDLARCADTRTNSDEFSEMIGREVEAMSSDDRNRLPAFYANELIVREFGDSDTFQRVLQTVLHRPQPVPTVEEAANRLLEALFPKDGTFNDQDVRDALDAARNSRQSDGMTLHQFGEVIARRLPQVIPRDSDLLSRFYNHPIAHQFYDSDTFRTAMRAVMQYDRK